MSWVRRIWMTAMVVTVGWMGTDEAAAQTAPGGAAPGATPAPSPVEVPVRGPGMAELEGIFAEQLKARHIPLLGSYLTMLQSLATDADDKAPYDEEIRRVQEWISSGGVVDLRVARKALDSDEQMALPGLPAPKPPPGPRPLLPGESWVVLTPDLAREIQPDLTTDDLAAADGVEVNLAEWRIELLPPGSYEVVLRYASADGVDFGTPVRVTFAGQRLDDDVPPVKRERVGGALRVAALGRLQISAPLEAEVLTFQVLGGGDALIRLKELIIAPQGPLQRGAPGN